MKEDGVTLTELLVVISIIGILTVALGFSFSGWMGSYRIESTTKQLYSDLMEARTRAMTRNRAHFVTFTLAQYTTQEDLDPWPLGNGILTADDSNRPTGYVEPIPLLQKAMPSNYQIVLIGGGSFVPIRIDTRGLISETSSFLIDTGHPACCPTNSCGPIDKEKCFHPDFDCINLTELRIQMGKYNGTICATK